MSKNNSFKRKVKVMITTFAASIMWYHMLIWKHLRETGRFYIRVTPCQITQYMFDAGKTWRCSLHPGYLRQLTIRGGGAFKATPPTISKAIVSRDGTKPIQSTRSIGHRVNFKVSVSQKNLIPIPSTFRYYFDTFPILHILVYELHWNSNRTQCFWFNVTVLKNLKWLF